MTLSMTKTTAEIVDATWKCTDFMEFIRQARTRNDQSISSLSHCGFNVGVSNIKRQHRKAIKIQVHFNVRRSKVRLLIRIPNKTAIPSKTGVKMKVMCIQIVSGEGENCTCIKEYDVSQRDVDIKAFHYTKRLFHESQAETMTSANNNSLTVRFKIEIYLTQPLDSDCPPPKKDTASCEADVLNDFQNLLNESNTADVEIRVTLGIAKSFYCHKSILAARSPVFRTMFDIPMKEAKENLVTLDDLSAEAFEHFVSFLYCGRFQNPTWTNFLPELVYASDKYFVESLKELCDDNLLQYINPRNALQFGKIAERHNLLKAAAEIRKFVAENANNVRFDISDGDMDL